MSEDNLGVDIVVPVYRGLAPTRRCIESVLASANRTAFELVVTDDASPEPELSAWLDELAAAGRITLLRNPQNLGFVATVNRAMALHPERDAVLLNSDTEVAGDWLDRLLAHAAADPRIGTITPLSNNGSICSYPNMLDVNALPAGWTLAALDALCARVNAGQAVDLPTGVGFCLYVRRACWQALGGFDIANFARGYGEECDFCRRAAKAGWRNVLAADVFVFHEGSISFGAEREGLMAAGTEVMNRLHPEYHEQVMAFLRADPARRLRDNLTRARGRRLPADCGTVLEELIAERDARAAWLVDKLEARERDAAQLREELAATRGRADELAHVLANAERFVREREAEVARLLPRCAALEQEATQMRAALDDLQARFDAIANSRVWGWSRRILRWLRLR
ncbi:glycosyltransferase [Immundisolibacter sp.]|uniref:glycosyltransferase family 2 protein n=1 Tax=Immundisolibacter sp. TaxID=1934948 RepID=UPI00261A5ABD|nr:glycosyltransferase [Immundisolibacter sp.]MDD3651871.1 glycosyltransferase [Immundisolibacter sp.]